MEFDSQTITNLVGLIVATCAIIGVISKMITKVEERQNRQRAEDIARQEAQRQEDIAQRKEESREIKDQIYNHLPTQIRAVEDGPRAEMRETEKRIIDRINELFAAYLPKDKSEKED